MTYETKFEAELMKLVNAERDRLIESITNTIAIKSLDDYRYLAGKIDVLRDTIPDLCEAANAILAKR